MKKPTHFDLFSGVGGFSLAAKWAGFETIGFSEIEPFCCKVLEKNFPGVKNYGDIKQIESIPKVNLLTGGFPCQPFSQAGNKKGIEDDRYLWPEFRRIIRDVRPDWVIIENVPTIISLAFEDIVADLENDKYEWDSCVIPACAANAPHRRDRLWLVAYTHSIRDNERLYHWEFGQLQKNIEWHVAQIQPKWAQLQPNTWATYTARDWLDYNTRASRGNDGVPIRMDKDRIKALGNAIVPQVIYPVMEFIKLMYG